MAGSLFQALHTMMGVHKAQTLHGAGTPERYCWAFVGSNRCADQALADGNYCSLHAPAAESTSAPESEPEKEAKTAPKLKSTGKTKDAEAQEATRQSTKQQPSVPCAGTTCSNNGVYNKHGKWWCGACCPQDKDKEITKCDDCGSVLLVSGRVFPDEPGNYCCQACYYNSRVHCDYCQDDMAGLANVSTIFNHYFCCKECEGLFREDNDVPKSLDDESTMDQDQDRVVEETKTKAATKRKAKSKAVAKRKAKTKSKAGTKKKAKKEIKEQVWNEDDHSSPDETKGDGWRQPGGRKNRGGTVYVEQPYEVCRIIATDGTFKDLPKRTVSLKEAQAIVGGYVEVMQVADGSGRILIVNEQGLSRGLAINKKAAALVYQDVRGDVILCEDKWFS